MRPKQRLDAEHLEQLGRRGEAADLFRAVRPLHVQGRSLHERQRVERAGLRLPGDEVDGMHAQRLGGIEGVLVEDHDPVRISIWQRREQDRVHEREDRRVGADADRQRQDRHGAEPRALPKRPQRVDQVLAQAVERAPGRAHRGTLPCAARRRPCPGGRRTRASAGDMPPATWSSTRRSKWYRSSSSSSRSTWRPRSSDRTRKRAWVIQRMAVARQTGLTTREMADDSRSHSAVSAFRALRPAAVSA